MEIQDKLCSKCWTGDETFSPTVLSLPLAHNPMESFSGGSYLQGEFVAEDAELYLLATIRGAITPIVKAAVW